MSSNGRTILVALLLGLANLAFANEKELSELESAANQSPMPPILDRESIRSVADTFKKLTGNEIVLPAFEPSARSNGESADLTLTNRDSSNEGARDEKPTTALPGQKSLWEQLEILQKEAEPDLTYSAFDKIRAFLADNDQSLEQLKPFDKDFVKKLEKAAGGQFKSLDSGDVLKEAQNQSVKKFIEINSNAGLGNGESRNRKTSPAAQSATSH